MFQGPLGNAGDPQESFVVSSVMGLLQTDPRSCSRRQSVGHVTLRADFCL